MNVPHTAKDLPLVGDNLMPSAWGGGLSGKQPCLIVDEDKGLFSTTLAR